MRSEKSSTCGLWARAIRVYIRARRESIYIYKYDTCDAREVSAQKSQNGRGELNASPEEL